MRKQVEDTLIVTTYKDLSDYHIQNIGIKPSLKRLVMDIKGDDDNTRFSDAMKTLKLSLLNSVECFEVCEENEHIKSVDGIVYSKDGLHLGLCPKKKHGKVIIPEGVKTIEAEAFAECSISEVVLPKTMREIRYYAFSNSSLEAIHVNDGLYTICDGVFSYCKKLKSFDFVSSIHEIGPSAFLQSGLNDVTLNEGIEHVNVLAFEGCDIDRINVPESVHARDGSFINFKEVYVKNYRIDILKGCTYRFQPSDFGDMFTLLYIEDNLPIVVPKYVESYNISRLDYLIKRSDKDWNFACILFKYGISRICRLMTALETAKRYPEFADEAIDYLNLYSEDVVRCVANDSEKKFVNLLQEIKWSQNALEGLLEAARKRGFVNGQAYVLKMLGNDYSKNDDNGKLNL